MCPNKRKDHKQKRAINEAIIEDKQKRYFEMEREPVDNKIKERFFKPAYKKWGER